MTTARTKERVLPFCKKRTGKTPEGKLFDSDSCRERIARRQDESGNVWENIVTALAVKE